MSKLNFLITFFSLFLIINSTTENEDFCQKVECYPGLAIGTCIKVESTISLLNPCPSSQYCETNIEDPIEDSFCEEKKDILPFKKLPTLPCNDSSECISGYCNAYKCNGGGEGDDCQSVVDCIYGKTCRQESKDIYKCLDPVKEGGKCYMDTDCELDYGCREGICTKYFSLDNWEKTGGSDYENDFNFCKSGYVNEVGICMNISLKNDITECSFDSPCEYQYEDENKTTKNIIIHQNCLCGYNPFGKKYCLIGSGNANYTRYIEKLKKYHFNNTNCHLSERNSEGCQKDILYGDEKKLLEINELINAKYWAKYNNRMIYAPECVYSTELKDYNRTLDINTSPEPIPEGKCAKYTCSDSIKVGVCALSNYKDHFNINVTLSDVCDEGAKCKIGGEPNDVFYNGSNIEGKCGSLNNMRYPGEKCSLDSECVYPLNNPSTQFHKCEDGYCSGIDEDGICEDNSWCLVGFYCDKSDGKCKSQLKQGKTCSESKDCKNNLVCINSKCEELFSLNDGDSVPENESPEFKKMFCKNGEILNNKCVSFNDLEGTKGSDDQYKKCDYNSYCEYKVNGLESWRKKYVQCGCGYNTEGQGYCPHFHDYSQDDWNKYRDLWKDTSDNGCHTESRFNCYEYDEEKGYELKKIRNQLENGHLFYGCVDCAKKVLEGNYLIINKYIMGLLFGLTTFLL